AGVDAAYAEASVVVSAARYEAFGMAIAEAVVRGLPVVTTPAGVLGHLPPGAVVVVRDDDALRVELDHLLSHPEARAAQAEAAARAIVPDWAAQARRLAAVLTELG
ncbi:MAG: glycosyltransferase, partial [Myxococcota bacterium]